MCARYLAIYPSTLSVNFTQLLLSVNFTQLLLTAGHSPVACTAGTLCVGREPSSCTPPPAPARELVRYPPVGSFQITACFCTTHQPLCFSFFFPCFLPRSATFLTRGKLSVCFPFFSFLSLLSFLFFSFYAFAFLSLLSLLSSSVGYSLRQVTTK